MTSKLPFAFQISSLFLLFFIWNNSLFSQRTCGTMHQDSINRLIHPEMGSMSDFEYWLQEKVAASKQKQALQKTAGTVYTLPVIFHVIHNGESVGSGTNISQEQIESQIEVLNEDFRKIEGSNGWNDDPVGADTEIDFCLVTKDEDGNDLAEPGINRVNRNDMGWTSAPYGMGYIDATIKPSTIWDPEQFMNIWVLDLGNGLLGYAQFPGGTTLPDNPTGGSANTDGVVLWYQSVGAPPVNSFPGPYNLGRTATHEIGHWLALYHIWGDANCGDDYCDDTPVHQTANYGCPTHPKANSCGTSDEMFENYMDYSDDACFNIFTEDQKIRMRTVLENSPRRASLVNNGLCSGSTGSNLGCAFTLSQTTVLEGQPVSITDNTSGDPTSWSWSFTGGTPSSSSAQNPSNIVFWSAGTYSITLSASNADGDCSISQSITVLADTTNGCAGLAAETNAVPPSCQQTNGVITVEPIGGTSPYEYEWSNGSTQPYLTNIAPGSYSITITDADNCQYAETIQLGENSPEINPYIVKPSCSGICNGSASALIQGGTSPYSYQWNTGAGSSSLNGICEGIYSVTVTDSEGCIDSSTFAVESDVTITVASNSSNSTCLEPNGSASASGNGGTAPYTYLWSNGQSGATIQNIVGDVYTVTVSDNGGCFKVDTVVVGNIGADGVEINDASICIGDNAVLSASGGVSYQWSTGATSSSITVSVSSDTSYMITVTDSYNCTVESPVYVVLNNVPFTSVSSTASNEVCAGTSVVLTAFGGQTYEWSHDNENTSNIAIVNPYSTTSYSVQAFNGGCGGNITSTTVNVISPAPVADGDVDDDVVYLNDEGEALVNFLQNSSLGEAFEWDFDGDGVYDYSGTTGNTSHTYTTIGNYMAVLNVYLNGCFLTDTVEIKVLSGVGIEDIAEHVSVDLFPNPNDGTFSIRINNTRGLVQIKVYNTIGKEVYFTQVGVSSQKFEKLVNLNNMADGVYIVNVTTSKGTLSNKLIIRER